MQNTPVINMHACVSLSDRKYTLEQRRMGKTATVPPSVQGPIQSHGMLEWRR